MATRQDVLDGIATINDGGNNTALEVRDVLGLLLDYTENDIIIPQPTIEFFHFFNSGNPVDDTRGGRLWYSMKGTQGTIADTVNFTFNLQILESNLTDPSFEITEANGTAFSILEKMTLGSENLSFSVPIRNSNGRFPSNATINIEVIKGKNILRMIIEGVDVVKGDFIFTSVHFHIPEFKRTLKTKKKKEKLSTKPVVTKKK